MPSRNEVAGFRLQASYFLAAAPKNNQKTPPRDGGALSPQKQKRGERVPCAPQPERGPCTGHPWPVHGRFGILPRPARTHARANAAPTLRCSAPPTGGGKSKANCQRQNRKRFRLLRYWVCAFNSCPTRSRMREALPTWAVVPRNCAEHRKLVAIWARAFLARGEAGMPKRSQTGQGRPVCEPRHERGAQGTPLALLVLREGRSSREAAFFGYFLALLPKSNSPEGENPRFHSAKADARPDCSYQPSSAAGILQWLIQAKKL